MAKKVNLNEAFITDDVRNDISIEKAVRQNVDRIKDTKINEIYTRLMNMLDIKSVNDCKYFSIDEFKALIVKTRADKKAKLQAKQQDTTASTSTASTSSWNKPSA